MKTLKILAIIITIMLFYACTYSNKKEEPKIKEKPFICKCFEESQKTNSQWYYYNEAECLKRSNNGERCNE